MDNKSEVITDKKEMLAMAKAALNDEKKERAILCGQAVGEIIKKFNCDLIAVPIISPDGTIHAQIQIIAKD